MKHRLPWRSLVAVAFMLLLSGLFVARRVSDDAGLALAASDKAFDADDLKRAVLEARFAAMESLVNSSARRSSADRLEAVAVGSESANRPKTALLAYMSLVSLSQSHPVYSEVPRAQHSEQQVTYLIDKITGPNSVATTPASASRLVLSIGSFSGSFARFLLLPAIMLALVGGRVLPTRLLGASSKASVRNTRSLFVALVAAACWCVGWFVT